MYSLKNLFKDTDYKSSVFTQDEINFIEQNIFIKNNKPYINCLIRKKDIQLKPEEAVRQLFVYRLIHSYGYSPAQIELEHPIQMGSDKSKRADIVIFEKNQSNAAYIIVEVKKPGVLEGEGQLKSYCNATGAPMGVWTNGNTISYYYRQNNRFVNIAAIPNVNQTLEDILRKPKTIAYLVENDILQKGNKTLKKLIVELEDDVLANAGVNAFEEVFKLIYTKLYDEFKSGRDENRALEFRNYNYEDSKLEEVIQSLFQKAQKKWQGVFPANSKINLSPSHLKVCVSALQDVKLFNSNLEVIDDAFEYLMNKSQKGEKGQFFTPRYVIDMCVKMLNPKEFETMIDTAAGSCGFPMHTIFYVWDKILQEKNIKQSHLLTLQPKPPECEDYVNEKVFAIDFDEEAVRVARTLNLIAGDGKTNVLHLNTLDYDGWNSTVQKTDWQKKYSAGWLKFIDMRAVEEGNKDFTFDIVMANPPFAGDIKESRIIAKYELGKKSNDKYQSKIGILFIERNLQFLKPGGRMAIILPQGRFNNSSDKYIRDFIAKHCRILAVVGLHGNVFKPHTGTKTSVLFVQKWDDVLCPRRDDYPIFFATMTKPSKDNSGEKIYLKNPDGSLFRDNHNHLIVDHDLFNHEGLTHDGIAEAFIEFAKKEHLSFFDSSSFDETKYKSLSEELECTEIFLSKVIDSEKTFRLDAEFFQKKYVELFNKLNSITEKHLIDFAEKIDVGFVGTMIEEYTENISDPILLQTKNISEFEVNLGDVIHINKNFHNRLKKSQIHKENILLARSGSFGKASIWLNNFVANSADIIIVKTKENISPYFLVSFINSFYGREQLFRFASGGLQGHVNLTILENLIVPVFSKEFQEKISELVKSAHEKLSQAQEKYHAAEQILSAELGLENFVPSTENVTVKNFSASFKISGRLDAEFYQPKYDDIEQKIKNFDTTSIPAEYEILKNSGTNYAEGISDVGVIKTKQITNQGVNVDGVESYFSNNACVENGSIFLENGDVIFASMGVGSLGKISLFMYDGDKKFVTDSTLKIYRVKANSKILPAVLCLFIQSKIGQEIIYKYVVGSTGIINIYDSDIAKIPIPILPIELQQKIAAQVEESFKLRDESKKLLELAKKLVEREIEKV